MSRIDEAPAADKVCDKDTLLFISQNTEKYLRNKRQSLEVTNMALGLGAVDGFIGENKTQYMFFAGQDGTENKQKLTSLIQHIEENDPNRNKDFSSVIIGTGGDNPHVSTLLMNHSNHRLFLFDTSEDIHQDLDPATRTVSASAEIFGNLASDIRCLNITGQALQDDSSCTYWTTCFADTLKNCNSIDDIVKGQQGQEFLNPDVLDKTMDKLCEIDSNMILGLTTISPKTFTTDSPAGNLLQSLQAEMARQSVAVFAANQQQHQQQGTLFVHRNNPRARHPITPNYRDFC